MALPVVNLASGVASTIVKFGGIVVGGGVIAVIAAQGFGKARLANTDCHTTRCLKRRERQAVRVPQAFAIAARYEAVLAAN